MERRRLERLRRPVRQGRQGGKKDEKDRTKQVPCDTDKLIQAITFANNEDGGVLELAKGCTYNLTRNQAATACR